MKIINDTADIKKWAESTELIPIENIKILYSNDYWDGPLEGVLSWQEQKYYFICYNDSTHEQEVERRYAIIEMTEDQAEEESYFHKLFVEYVGNHFEYDDNGNRNSNIVNKTKEEQQKFYSEYNRAKKYTITENQVKARF